METQTLDQRRKFIRRARQRALVDERAVCALRRVAPDGLQMAGAPSRRRRGRARGSQSRAASLSASHRRPGLEALMLAARRRVWVGRQETAGRAAPPVSDARLAGAQHRQRSAGAASPAAAAAATSPLDASRARAADDDAAESGVAGRLQRPVQDRRWALLLSVDRHGSFQSRAAGLSRAALDPRRRGPAGVSHAVSRGRAARRDPHRQRHALRVDRDSRLVGA